MLSSFKLFRIYLNTAMHASRILFSYNFAFFIFVGNFLGQRAKANDKAERSYYSRRGSFVGETNRGEKQENRNASRNMSGRTHPRPRGRKMAFRRDAFSDPMMEAS